MGYDEAKAVIAKTVADGMNTKAAEKLAEAVNNIAAIPMTALSLITDRPQRVELMGKARAKVTVLTAQAEACALEIRTQAVARLTATEERRQENINPPPVTGFFEFLQERWRRDGHNVTEIIKVPLQPQASA